MRDFYHNCYASYLGTYSRVAAIAFRGDIIELRYVWPRTSKRLLPKDIISVDWEQGSRMLGDLSEPEYTLHLHTRSRHYVSFSDTSLDDMLRSQQHIKTMQEQ